MRGRPLLELAPVVVLLAAADVAPRLTTRPAARVAVPVASLLAVGLSRLYGATWEELGLARSSWRRGLALGAASGAAVTGAVALAAALPISRSFFLDDRYRKEPAAALRYALAAVPLQTVAPEELAFRGVLLALLTKSYGERAAGISTCVLFGLWHIPSSIDLGPDNQALSSRFGTGRTSQVLGIAATVLATAAADNAFVRLRRRSGHLLAPAGLHWAFNGAAVLATAAAWRSTDAARDRPRLSNPPAWTMAAPEMKRRYLTS